MSASNNCKQPKISPIFSSEISRLVKHMVSVPSNTLSIEDSREAQVFGDLVLRDDVVCAFGLTDDEFTDLRVWC